MLRFSALHCYADALDLARAHSALGPGYHGSVASNRGLTQIKA
jgi:hypothetical protein